MGSMPNLFVGMPVLTPIPLEPSVTSVPSLVPMTMTLPLANGDSSLLSPSPIGTTPGPQVRNALTASNLTQTQLATIWPDKNEVSMMKKEQNDIKRK
ncbi:unnamed protein product [Coregonus sp. 'balchen']|nr:unnamed protein product [Coregonus sp. 'balchen']